VKKGKGRGQVVVVFNVPFGTLILIVGDRKYMWPITNHIPLITRGFSCTTGGEREPEEELAGKWPLNRNNSSSSD